MNIKNLFFRATQAEKRKAAMALNLCATSVSRILASDDMEILDVEYETILNNLNLQNMLKDEALLSSFKSVLDTITFYRIQEGDRNRLEARYRQKLNNAIWSVGQQGTCILMASAVDPTPWALVSAAIMSVGAYCNVKREREDAEISHDDEKWQLERSLIEQLHALRLSLFETSWKLADRYDFDDAWRLTLKQIDQYNKILEDPDPAWRHFKLSQYADDFEAYPYYWNELGESAFLAAIDIKEDSVTRQEFLEKSEMAFRHFIETDMRLLREDMISASARLRLVQIVHESTKSWEKAIESVSDFGNTIRNIACSAPELLVQAAVIYVSAYVETKITSYLDEAIRLMETVVGQSYDIPSSSRLLSKLYLMGGGRYDIPYEALMQHVGIGSVVPREGGADEKLLAFDRACVSERIMDVLSRQFDAALKLSNRGLFKGDESTVDERIRGFLAKKGSRKDSVVIDMLVDVWNDIKVQLNDQMRLVVKELRIGRERVAKVAQDLDAVVLDEINKYSCNIADWLYAKDSRAQQQKKIYQLRLRANSVFVAGLSNVICAEYDVKSFSDVDCLLYGVAAIERSLVDMCRRRGIKEGDEAASVDYFGLAANGIEDGEEIKWTEYCTKPTWGAQKIRERKSFRILVDSMSDVLSASRRLASELERAGCKVRVYTQGTICAALYPPLGAAWAFYTMAHRLITFDPDYEVVRYPKSVEVRYMRADIHESAADDDTVFSKTMKGIKHDGMSFVRMLSELSGLGKSTDKSVS